MNRPSLFAALVVLSSAVSAPAQVPRGPEFGVNTFTSQVQTWPGVASADDGSFVVVWESGANQDGSGFGVFARRYDTAGVPIGASEFRVNSFTTANQSRASVSGDGSGAFVVTWMSEAGDGYFSAVFGRRYDASGTPQGADFVVNSFTTFSQRNPEVASDASGNFVVVWESFDNSEYGVFGRRFDATGTALGPDFPVNLYTTNAQTQPSVAMTVGGGFVVVWVDWAGGGFEILGRRFDASGTPQGADFPVNANAGGVQFSPAVAATPDGGFVVVWAGPDASASGVFGRRYDASGTPQGGDFQVNSYTTSYQAYPSISSDPSGFTVTWAGYRSGSSFDVFGRKFDLSGTPRGDEFQVNSYSTSSQVYPVVASDALGNFVVAWSSYRRDGHNAAIAARRFAPDLIFADGFELGNLSAWSAANVDGGDLAASSAAALKFSGAGLQGLVDDTVGIYVEDDSPQDDDRYRARFYFDTNGFDPGEAQAHRRVRLFIVFEETPLRRLAAVVLRRLTGVYGVMGRARLDDNSQADTGFVTIGDGPHFIEIDWRRATGPDAHDGSFELWVDGASVSALTGLDNSISSVDLVRLGALSVKAGAAGTLYWDEFESRRSSYIGP